MYLENIKNPKDLNKLNLDELTKLASEMRQALLAKLAAKGGHFGPNFAMVEMTIALHHVFNSPIDKMVFDVSHQTYPHKMLTGRNYGFLDPNRYTSITGFTSPKESDHDLFTIGHTSTSISLALGLAKARDLKGNNENVIAIIGDGSLSGGEALEGLNVAGELGSNFIIVVNDNDMSIAENHGGLYENLKELRQGKGLATTNLFKAMNLDYIYVDDGHDIAKLIEVFEKVKDINHPVVVHIKTQKGKGYELAQNDRETWHYSSPFDINTGKRPAKSLDTYQNITAEFLLEKMKKDPKVCVLTAGVPGAIGFNLERRKLAGKQFVDVGIAEETGVAMASGLAKNGAKPVFATNSTFMQRTFDQLSQDLCIDSNPATMLILNGSVFGMKDVTHLGFFDIPMIANIPNMVYLAPTSKEEYLSMLDWSIEQDKYPVSIKVPGNGVYTTGDKVDTEYSNQSKYQITQKGSKIAVLALGSFYQLGQELVEELNKKLNIEVTLINPRYITGLDTETLTLLKENHDTIITLEDGILDGGFGQKIASFYGDSKLKVFNYGLKREFKDRYDVDEVLKENHLTVPQIIEDILK